MNYTSLFQFKNFGANTPKSYGGRLNGAPRLVPAGGLNYASTGSNNFIASDNPGYSLIDIINNFQWTTTPKTGRQEVPAIYLKEKRLVTNALIAQAIYYSLALTGIAGGSLAGFNALPQNLKTIVLGIAGAFAGKLIGNATSNLANSVAPLASLFGRNPLFGEATRTVGGAAIPGFTALGALGGLSIDTDTPTEALSFAGEQLQRISKLIPERFNIESLGSDTLRPYEGLYITEDTKFLYNFPYFSDLQNNITNQFQDWDEAFTNLNATGMGDLTRSMREVAMGASAVVNFEAPGIYVEKPQFFNFNTNGESLRFSFPLINTGWATFDDVVKNWQLLYLLIYQNRPNRRSRDLIDPPVIYEVTIPGVRYNPFAYISRLEVNFKGSRRRMNIPVPYNGGFINLNTIIPDAYVVDITLQTLVGETQNFLYSMINDKQNIVVVTDNYNPVDYASKLFQGSYNQVRSMEQERTGPNLIQGVSNAVGNFSNAVNNTPRNISSGILNSIGGLFGNTLP